MIVVDFSRFRHTIRRRMYQWWTFRYGSIFLASVTTIVSWPGFIIAGLTYLGLLK